MKKILHEGHERDGRKRDQLRWMSEHGLDGSALAPPQIIGSQNQEDNPPLGQLLRTNGRLGLKIQDNW